MYIPPRKKVSKWKMTHTYVHKRSYAIISYRIYYRYTLYDLNITKQMREYLILQFLELCKREKENDCSDNYFCYTKNLLKIANMYVCGYIHNLKTAGKYFFRIFRMKTKIIRAPDFASFWSRTFFPVRQVLLNHLTPRNFVTSGLCADN
jgi:hypothetical protein